VGTARAVGLVVDARGIDARVDASPEPVAQPEGRLDHEVDQVVWQRVAVGREDPARLRAVRPLDVDPVALAAHAYEGNLHRPTRPARLALPTRARPPGRGNPCPPDPPG